MSCLCEFFSTSLKVFNYTLLATTGTAKEARRRHVKYKRKPWEQQIQCCKSYIRWRFQQWAFFVQILLFTFPLLTSDHMKTPSRKYIELIHSSSSKWANWDPPHLIEVSIEIDGLSTHSFTRPSFKNFLCLIGGRLWHNWQGNWKIPERRQYLWKWDFCPLDRPT